MPDLWLPGIPRVDCSANGLGLGYGNSTDCYHSWHTFEGIPANYNYSPLTGARYLASTLKLAHFTYNPVLGGLVQLLPANKAARTLKAGTSGTYAQRETNCRGKIHMQTEVLANAARPWTLDLTRAGLDDLTTLMNFLRSWGVVDQWAWRDVVRPAATYTESNAAGYRRWPDRSGHTFHSKWPHNSHWDPGAIAAPWTLAPTVDPNKGFTLEHLERVESLLDVLGYEGADVWARVRAYQADHDLTVDGLPGPRTTTHLEATMTNLTQRMERVEKHLGLAPLNPTPAPAPAPTPTNYRVKAPSGVNVRSGPGTAHPVVSTMRVGDRWRVSRKDGNPIVKDGWMMGRSDAMYDADAAPGWVHTDNLEVV